VTERVRLATTVLVLPSRNEVTVAKQAAVIDRLSGGRLDLGLAVGGRESDYKALGARFTGRGKKFERQVRKIRKTWRAAKKATETEGATGPAPMQKPLPPLWLGAYASLAIERAVELGDNFIFGTAGAAFMAEQAPKIRELAAAANKKSFQLAGMAYVAIGDDPAAALDEGSKRLSRYYEGTLPKPAEDLIHAGPIDVIAQATKEYEAAGIDVLILCPLIADVKQVDLIAEHVLPSYRVPARA